MKHFAFALLACLALAGPAQAGAPPDNGPVVALAGPHTPQAAPAGLSGVLPLTVTLATAHNCPAPSAPRDLLPMPQGCLTPWAGVLYTPQADADTRAEFAAVDRVAGKLDDELARCRQVRAQLADAVARQLPGIGDQLDTVADLLQPSADPAPRPAARRSALPWAAVGGGLTLGGSGLAYLLGASPGRIVAAGAGGAVLSIGGAFLVDVFDG